MEKDIQPEDWKKHFRHILLFFFNKGIKVTEAQRELCIVYGDSAISYDTCQRWFARFRDGNFSLEDNPRNGRPITIDDDQILEQIKSNRHISTREVAQCLGVEHSTISKRLKSLGFMKKIDTWIPHNLSEKNILDRIAICESLLKWNSLEPFLKRVITGDEKWIVYENIKLQRSWCGPGESSQPVAKPDLHQKKVMLSVWWDWKGILYYELIASGQTINSTKYCAQLEELKEVVQKKRPELVNRKNVVFHHDNAKPHTALVTKLKLNTFKWEVMQHPPYSPDLAPTDYHLFRSLQNHLNTQRFNSVESIKQCLDTFFASKPQSFYENGIMGLSQRWEQVVNKNGQYIDD